MDKENTGHLSFDHFSDRLHSLSDPKIVQAPGMFYGDIDEDKLARFREALHLFKDIFGSVYAQDNLIALTRSAGFRADSHFRAAFDQFAGTDQEKSLMWRLHTLTWATEQCLSVPGDFVECGVWRGFCSAVVMAYLGFEDVQKCYYLYDTFRGIPSEYNSENRTSTIYEEEMQDCPDAILNHVRGLFARYPNASIVPGIVPDSFSKACPDQIAFLHLDMNSAASEIAALEHLYDRLAPGALIVLDDYGWTGYAAQKHAEDAFFTARGQRVLELPTGQGLVLLR